MDFAVRIVKLYKYLTFEKRERIIKAIASLRHIDWSQSA